ncbi:MAG TPA: hypothetical protein VFO52_00265 [Longimicrobiales bacterium]|nr:hypothetical protein [Longimicrobiales bacterium]
MKVLWSAILLLAVSLGICTVYFFGHGLSVDEKGKWFAFSAVCLVASVALFYSVVKFDRHTPDATHH